MENAKSVVGIQISNAVTARLVIFQVHGIVVIAELGVSALMDKNVAVRLPVVQNISGV